MATINDIIKKSFFGLCGLTSAAHGRCRMTRIQASSEKDDAKMVVLISRHVERTWYLSTFAILLRLVSFWRGNVHHSLAMVVSSSSLYFQVRQVSIPDTAPAMLRGIKWIMPLDILCIWLARYCSYLLLETSFDSIASSPFSSPCLSLMNNQSLRRDAIII